MTSNQIAYKQAEEQIRHNKATETIQMLGTLVDLGEAVTHKSLAEAQSFHYFSGGLANIANAQTNQRNASTNELNAFTNMYEAITGRMNAESNRMTASANQANAATNWYNAQTNRINANTNIQNMLINAYDAETKRFSAGVSLLNAMANISQANTKALEVSNYYELQSNAQLIGVIEFMKDLEWQQTKQENQIAWEREKQSADIKTEYGTTIITSASRLLGDLIGAGTKNIGSAVGVLLKLLG